MLQDLDIEIGFATAIAGGGFIGDALGHSCLSRIARALTAGRGQ
jgi:hypothetical protein